MKKLIMLAVVAGLVGSNGGALAAPASEGLRVRLDLATDNATETALHANISSLDAQVAKKNEHVIVAINATIKLATKCAFPSVMVSPRVNGVDLARPFPAFVDAPGVGGEGCTATGTFWLDLDAAEIRHPGLFLGQPLHVELTYVS